MLTKTIPTRPQARQAPEAYPLGYVRDGCEPRMQLGAFFRIRLGISVAAPHSKQPRRSPLQTQNHQNQDENFAADRAEARFVSLAQTADAPGRDSGAR